MLENKLGITEATVLAEMEAKISRKKAIEMYENGFLDHIEQGTFAGLAAIHRYLFAEIYDFAGQQRQVDIAKGYFQFASVLYLKTTLQSIDRLPQSTFDEIIEKYVEMNIAHPFREGNGRSTRIWLDQILKTEIGYVVDWSKVQKEDYLLAMVRSPVNDFALKLLLKSALTHHINDMEIYKKGLAYSYYYEGFELDE